MLFRKDVVPGVRNTLNREFAKIFLIELEGSERSRWENTVRRDRWGLQR